MTTSATPKATISLAIAYLQEHQIAIGKMSKDSSLEIIKYWLTEEIRVLTYMKEQELHNFNVRREYCAKQLEEKHSGTKILMGKELKPFSLVCLNLLKIYSLIERNHQPANTSSITFRP